MAQKSLGGHSAACCSVPPIEASSYKAKGNYEEIAGMKTYVTGPADATKAVLIIGDIFGFYDQTIQGADIIAYAGGQDQYQVFVPNLFHNGQPADLSWFPPNDKEKEKKLGDFFSHNPPQQVAKGLPDKIQVMHKKYPSIEKWAILGFCWGGKITTLSLQEGSKTPFSAAAVCHPAFVDPEDGKAITTPFALLASKDEKTEDVDKFVANLQGPKFTERYNDQIHGWMAARSDLSDDKVKKEYERGYCSVLEWFGKHL